MAEYRPGSTGRVSGRTASTAVRGLTTSTASTSTSTACFRGHDVLERVARGEADWSEAAAAVSTSILPTGSCGQVRREPVAKLWKAGPMLNTHPLQPQHVAPAVSRQPAPQAGGELRDRPSGLASRRADGPLFARADRPVPAARAARILTMRAIYPFPRPYLAERAERSLAVQPAADGLSVAVHVLNPRVCRWREHKWLLRSLAGIGLEVEVKGYRAGDLRGPGPGPIWGALGHRPVPPLGTGLPRSFHLRQRPPGRALHRRRVREGGQLEDVPRPDEECGPDCRVLRASGPRPGSTCSSPATRHHSFPSFVFRTKSTLVSASCRLRGAAGRCWT